MTFEVKDAALDHQLAHGEWRNLSVEGFMVNVAACGVPHGKVRQALGTRRLSSLTDAERAGIWNRLRCRKATA